MKLKKLIRPDGEIPEIFREEWNKTVFHRIKIRLHAMALSLLLGVLFVNFLAYKLNPDIFIWKDRLPRMIIVTLMMIVVMILNVRSRTPKQAKQAAAFAVLLVLVFFTGMGLVDFINDKPFPFTSLLVISVFFMGLMIPWTIRGLIAVAFTHLIFNALYFHAIGYIRTQQFQVLPDFELFLETFLLISAATVFCLSIRYQEIVKDVKSFILLKDTQIQKNKIEHLNDQINQELKLASNVQRTLIPEAVENENISADVLYLPMGEIGGDYAGLNVVGEGKLLAIICDVTGHGIPAALIVSRVHAEFENNLRNSHQPKIILKNLNRFIQKNFGETGMLLSAFCILFDFKASEAEYCSYGHPDQFHVSGDGQTINRMKSQASLLGIESLDVEIHGGKISFCKSDRFILFTDGLNECTDNLGKDYGDERIYDYIHDNPAASTVEWSRDLHSNLVAHQNGDFKDDIFVMNLRIK